MPGNRFPRPLFCPINTLSQGIESLFVALHVIRVTGHAGFFSTQCFPRKWDFECRHQESPRLAGMRQSPYIPANAGRFISAAPASPLSSRHGDIILNRHFHSGELSAHTRLAVVPLHLIPLTLTHWVHPSSNMPDCFPPQDLCTCSFFFRNTVLLLC